MSEFNNTDRGALFKNKDKMAEAHPDYNGTINVKGEDFWISAWLKTSKAGVKFMSLSVKEKKAAAPKPASRPAPKDEEFSDDVPF